MKFRVSAWAIRNPVPALLVFIVLTVLGLIGLHRLPIQNFPDFDVQMISVTASLEGAAPSQLETEVARKIEDKLATLGHVEHTTTTITDGAVFPQDGFAWEFNYRGDLVFLDQARAREKSRNLHVEDGWIYFIHGWTRVIAEVFHIDIPTRGPGFDRIAQIAQYVR